MVMNSLNQESQKCSFVYTIQKFIFRHNRNSDEIQNSAHTQPIRKNDGALERSFQKDEICFSQTLKKVPLLVIKTVLNIGNRKTVAAV